MIYMKVPPMKPEEKSKHLLKIVKSKAKMLEYDVPENFQNINYPASPNSLFPLAITLVADLCRKIRKNEPINDAVDILFSPQFFDSFVNAKFDDELSDYLNLIGSAAFYLADMPGSSSVLIKKVSDDFNLNIDGLEKILKWLLVGNINDNLSTNSVICSFVQYFFKTGDETLLLKECENLRKNAYDQNNATYLFYADIIDAVILKKINNSTWKLLPLYSNLSIEDWKKTLLLDNFIKELWPAQKIIGEKGCYKGESAVIQMPTSSGKTKSIEIILRSAFLSERDVNLAVIVAPFRALCHEINDSLKRAFCDDLADVSELSDVYQIDVSFDIFQKTNKPKILILTPEKLLYILHHDQSISDKIKLIIFDEAHQFDNGIRGITYELLLTSLKLSLSSNVQKILTSAVVPNANNIALWFNENNNVVSNDSLPSTPKSFGFTNWNTPLGQIHYCDKNNIDNEEFFVPRVIEQVLLAKKGKEHKPRYFPERNQSSSIALYLGLKLVKNGGVAIFCGRKDSAKKMANELKEALERGLGLTTPREYSNQVEIDLLKNLIALNLGEDSTIAQISHFGVFQHHGNIPQGIRIAIEYAMRENLIHFVICTSTLAQGVNLPIKYLIISSNRQAGDKIKTRDFYNLIGRTGRAGLYTEGSILFADSKIFDYRYNTTENWRWKETKELINIANSENCESGLIGIFYLRTDNKKNFIQIYNIEDFITSLLSNDLKKLEIELRETYKDQGVDTGIFRQLKEKKQLLSSIESFLLKNSSEIFLFSQDVQNQTNTTINPISTKTLAESTFAYFLANSEMKKNICLLFEIITKHIENTKLSKDQYFYYGKTLLGIDALQRIEKFLNENLIRINEIQDTKQLLEILWPLLSEYWDNEFVDISIIESWIQGLSFQDIAKLLNQSSSIDNIVDLLENKVAYNITIILGALIDLMDYANINTSVIKLLYLLQKQIKYGLLTKQEIILYEMGFYDRVIVNDLKNSLMINTENYAEIVHILKSDKAKEIMKKYPRYFQDKLLQLI